MLIGASVLCFLVLLALLADRAGAHWHGQRDRLFFHCEECDLRYPRSTGGGVVVQACPSGHPIVVEESGATAGSVAIFACVGFLVVAIALMVTGLVPH